MKLCTFEVSTSVGKHWRLGALTARGIIDLNFACAWHLRRKGEARPYALANVLVPDTMLEYLRGDRTSAGFAAATLGAIEDAASSGEVPTGLNGETLIYNPGDVRLRAPLHNPESFRNFSALRQHVRTVSQKRLEPIPAEGREMPVYANVAARSIIGPGEDVPWPRSTERWDYGLEIACVVGRPGRDIDAASAAEHIAGYTILNHFSARDIQGAQTGTRLAQARGEDWASAIGPVLVTPDEIADPYRLRMTARINGEVWSEETTASLPWRFEQMIEFLSRDDEVRAGDLVGSGIVGGGCGQEIDRWIGPGDVIELEIEKIGVLRNRVVRQ